MLQRCGAENRMANDLGVYSVLEWIALYTHALGDVGIRFLYLNFPFLSLSQTLKKCA